jgi:hypothetical protein
LLIADPLNYLLALLKSILDEESLHAVRHEKCYRVHHVLRYLLGLIGGLVYLDGIESAIGDGHVSPPELMCIGRVPGAGFGLDNIEEFFEKFQRVLFHKLVSIFYGYEY